MWQMSFLQTKDLLRSFGILIYTGDAIGDCLLMEDEIKELHEAGLIDSDIFRAALMAIRQRTAELKENLSI
ncbi:MAG TPA: YqgQ family protein [Bacillota bacterium]|nr:YqgQ family protein [Bacillota bacterium]